MAQMKRSMVGVAALLLASLSACGSDVAGARPAASDRVAVPGSGPSYTPVFQPRPGLADLPTWMPRKHHRARQKPYFDDFVPQPIALPDCPGGGVSPHFNTPDAAMTYLASAWNRDDLDELCQVTNPNARLLLLDMHREATNLRLQRCDRDGVGHYSCIFDHDYPKKMHKKGVGHTLVDVQSADAPGWYMTIYEGCG
jgi:hypothetical protein